MYQVAVICDRCTRIIATSRTRRIARQHAKEDGAKYCRVVRKGRKIKYEHICYSCQRDNKLDLIQLSVH